MRIGIRHNYSLIIFYLLLVGCAAMAPEGTRLAQMDFHQFTESAIANDNPELAKRFSASRAAVCQSIRNNETGPCISAATMMFQTSTGKSSDPEFRLIGAFENWCAAHGSHLKTALPKGSAKGLGESYGGSYYFSDFGSAVRNLKIKGGTETSVVQPKIITGRECPLGGSSVGLITTVVFSGLDENRQLKKSVLSLFYDEKDLAAFTALGTPDRTDSREASRKDQ